MSWIYAGSVFQRRDGASWSNDPMTVATGSAWDFRAWFTIQEILPPSPVNLGHLRIERNIDGAGWENWSHQARNQMPWRSEAGSPVMIVGDIVLWPGMIFGPVGEWHLRLRVDWDAGPYYTDPTADNIIVTVTPAPVDATEPPVLGVFDAADRVATFPGATVPACIPTEAVRAKMPGGAVMATMARAPVEAVMPMRPVALAPMPTRPAVQATIGGSGVTRATIGGAPVEAGIPTSSKLAVFRGEQKVTP